MITVVVHFITRGLLQLLPLWYILLPSIFLVRMFGAVGAATLLLQPLVFSLIARSSRSRTLTWATSLAILALLNTHPLTQVRLTVRANVHTVQSVTKCI